MGHKNTYPIFDFGGHSIAFGSFGHFFGGYAHSFVLFEFSIRLPFLYIGGTRPPTLCIIVPRPSFPIITVKILLASLHIYLGCEDS